MGPKRRGGKKGKNKKQKKQKDVNQLTAVDRTFYELTITDLNNKLARLRSHCAKLEGSNEEINEKMRHFEEDREDVTAHLDRQLSEKEDVIRELNERLEELAKVREEENTGASEKVKDWENKYKAMYEQLTSEIKLLNGKLNSLEEFRIQRTDLLMKFDEQETELKEQRMAHELTIHEMEQKAIIERDQLKKDVEAKLLQLAEDFTKSSEIRIAGYTRRLIRENIALNKEMDQMIASQLRMEEENRRIKERGNELEALFASSEDAQKSLVKTCQSQIKIIEDLTTNYESLKARYFRIVHYKNLYEKYLKRDVCEQFNFNEVSKKMKALTHKIDMLKSDKQKLISLHQQHEAEILRLSEILKNLKFTVQSAIRGEVDDSDDPEFRKAQRKNLLSELMAILGSYTEECILTPSVSTVSRESIYIPGKAGITPKSVTSLLDLFKREARKIATAEIISPARAIKPQDGKITPKAICLDEDTLVDVESGSTIIFSSSIEEEEAPPEAGLEDEQADFGATSSESVTPVGSATKVEDKKEKSKAKKEKIERKVSVERKSASIIKDEKVNVEEEEEHVKSISAAEEIVEEESVVQEGIIALEEMDEEEDDAGYFFY